MSVKNHCYSLLLVMLFVSPTVNGYSFHIIAKTIANNNNWLQSSLLKKRFPLDFVSKNFFTSKSKRGGKVFNFNPNEHYQLSGSYINFAQTIEGDDYLAIRENTRRRAALQEGIIQLSSIAKPQLQIVLPSSIAKNTLDVLIDATSDQVIFDASDFDRIEKRLPHTHALDKEINPDRPDWIWTQPELLGDVLLHHPQFQQHQTKYKSDTLVRLLACNAGSKTKSGNACTAQRVANRIGLPTLAANGLVLLSNYSTDNPLVIFRPEVDIFKPRWRIFYPQPLSQPKLD